jgi:hypothetical protein
MHFLKSLHWSHLNSLFALQLVYTTGMADKTPQHAEPSKPQSEQTDQEPKARKQIPLVSVPNDRDMMAEEMAELFDEDKVTHKHGSSEPEAD